MEYSYCPKCAEKKGGGHCLSGYHNSKIELIECICLACNHVWYEDDGTVYKKQCCINI